jgi:hypothetical protein
MSGRYYRASPADYQDWLNQHVWVNNMERVPRRWVIPQFAEELTLWLKSKGYVLDGRWRQGHKAVAKWLYALHVQVIARKRRYAPVQYPEIEHRDWPEDRDMFDCHIDQQAVEDFLELWQTHEDFDLRTDIGFRTACELPTMLWHYIDLEDSYHGRKMAKILEDSDSESEGDWDSRGDHLTDLTNGLHGTTKKILGVNTL